MRTFFAGTIICFVLALVVRAQEVEIMREAAVVRETTVSSDEHLEAESGNKDVSAAPAGKPSITITAPALSKQLAPIAKSGGAVTKQSVAIAPPAQPAGVVAKQPLPTQSKLTIEEMRRGGELAAEKLRKEIAAGQVASSGTLPSKPALIARPMERQVREAEPQPQFATYSGQTAFIRLADGFDFPVGKPDAKGYYRARGFRVNGHLGEDWDGVGGGDTDLGDPIYCIGDGIVVFARDCHMGWGNVIIVRHAYREGGVTRNVDSLYAHLQKILVRSGQTVRRGEQIATLGNAHGLYDAHLHLEIRKNIEIGMSRAKFAQDYSNYFDPSQFILTHRRLQGGAKYRVAMNTFSRDARIPWDKLRNYSHAHTGGSSSESAVALKKAVAAQTSQ